MSVHSSTPASRKEARRLSRRDAILDVAGPYFLEHGYGGTTMSAVAAALGGSKGTLWSYFPSKEMLFAAVIERASESFRAQLAAILRPENALDVALHDVCCEHMRKVTSPEAIGLHRLVAGAAGRFPEVGRIFYENAPRLTQRLIADYLAQAMERGLLRQADPLRAAQHLHALCMSRHYQQLFLGVIDAVTPEMIEADVASALDTFVAGYGA